MDPQRRETLASVGRFQMGMRPVPGPVLGKQETRKADLKFDLEDAPSPRESSDAPEKDPPSPLGESRGAAHFDPLLPAAEKSAGKRLLRKATQKATIGRQLTAGRFGLEADYKAPSLRSGEPNRKDILARLKNASKVLMAQRKIEKMTQNLSFADKAELHHHEEEEEKDEKEAAASPAGAAPGSDERVDRDWRAGRRTLAAPSKEKVLQRRQSLKDPPKDEITILEEKVAAAQMEINKDTEDLRELDSKIAARNQSIAYQENTLRRMRETVNRLRFVEAEIRESFDRHYAEGGAPPPSSLQDKGPFSGERFPFLEALLAEDAPFGGNATLSESPLERSRTLRSEKAPRGTASEKSVDTLSRASAAKPGAAARRFRELQLPTPKVGEPGRRERRRRSPSLVEEPAPIIPLPVKPLFKSAATGYLQALIALLLCNEDTAQTISLLLRKMSLADFQRRAVAMLTETCAALLAHQNLAANQEIARYSAQWLAIIQQITESSRATLYLPNDDGELVSRMSTLTTPSVIPVGDGVPGWCFEHGQSILTNDPYNDPRFNPVFDKRFKLDTSSVLCVPAFRGAKLIGVLELANKSVSGGGYGDLDEELARRACDYVGAGLLPPAVQAQLAAHEGAERAMAEQLIMEQKQHHMATLVAEIVGSIGAIAECERSTLFLHDVERKSLWTGFVRGGPGIEIPDNVGLAGACFTHNVLLNIPDCYEDPRFERAVDMATGYRTRTMMCAPVLHAVYGRPVGVLQVINKMSSSFTRQDEAQMRQLCSMASAVVLASDSLAELALAEEMTTRLFKALSIATVLFDMSGTCVRVNQDAIDLFFLERAEQWVGKKAQPIFGKANRKLYRLYETTKQTEETCMHEVRVYPSVGDSDGMVRFVRFEPFKLPGGDVVGVSLSLMPTIQESSRKPEVRVGAAESPKGSPPTGAKPATPTRKAAAAPGGAPGSPGAQGAVALPPRADG